MERYQIIVRSARGHWGHPVVIRVVDTTVGATSWHWVRRGTVRQWGQSEMYRGCTVIDAKHGGPRSRYRRCMDAAVALVNKLNAQ